MDWIGFDWSMNVDCIILGLSHGHTGHVRFLTCVEATPEVRSSRSHHPVHHHRYSLKGKDALVSVISSTANVSLGSRMLVISGGDGYEDFRHTGFSDSVGREDSTNHLLLWQIWTKKKKTRKKNTKKNLMKGPQFVTTVGNNSLLWYLIIRGVALIRFDNAYWCTVNILTHPKHPCFIQANAKLGLLLAGKTNNFSSFFSDLVDFYSRYIARFYQFFFSHYFSIFFHSKF